MGVLCLVNFLLFSTFWSSRFAIILMGKRAGCFALTVFRMSCDSQCSVALPHGAVAWSAVCDCGISCLYSLAFFTISSTSITLD